MLVKIKDTHIFYFNKQGLFYAQPLSLAAHTSLIFLQQIEDLKREVCETFIFSIKIFDFKSLGYWLREK